MSARRRFRTAILPLVKAERLDLVGFLADLHDEDWAMPSLCPGWTVHDVLAHLTMSSRQTTLATLVRVARARGDLDRAFAGWARERAAEFTPAELTEQLRATAGSTHRLAISAPEDPLIDILVHGQDIARPLGRERAMSPDHVVPALGLAWRSPLYGARKRFAGLRLVATDADWSAGEGAREVHGLAGDLLLLATGRATDRVTGPGADEVAARMRA